MDEDTMEECAPLRATWTARLLSVPPTTSSIAWVHCGQQLGVALAMSALFGAAIGLRNGGLAIAGHAAGLLFGVLAVCILAVPAFAIGLALVNASVDALTLAQASSRAAIVAGLVFVGLAPGAALFAVTVEDEITVSLVLIGGFALAGTLAMKSFVSTLGPRLSEAGIMSRFATSAFLVFGALLASRIWWMTLPLLRGGL